MRSESRHKLSSTKHFDAPLRWHGGKSYLADWIISCMPPHVHYVEPFAGGLAVLLRRDPNGVSEVVNDLDGDLSNFWTVLKDEDLFQEFVRKVEATPFSKGEFDDSAIPNADDDEVDRAVKFFVRCRQSRQGLRKDFATMSRSRTRRGMNEQVSSWLTAIEGLPDIHARLKRVVIFNEEAVSVIRREDSPNTCFYLDPPYMHQTRVTTRDYECEMSVEDHKKLLECLSEIEGKFLLSGYRNDLYDDFSQNFGWHRVDRAIDCKASSAKEKPTRTECLWMNYTKE
jgi:DNA adenine methylase